MKLHLRSILWKWTGAGLVLLTGCSQPSYEGYQSTSISSSSAARKALDAYDENSDGSLNESELAACPAILAAFSQYDSDGNGSVSRDELVARFDSLFFDGATFTNLECTITKGGRPVAGAKVKFTPEAFLGEGILPASGVTNRSGRTVVAAADEHVPESFLDRNVLQVAIYRVEVESGKSSALFGHEIDMLSRQGTAPRFDLNKVRSKAKH